LPSTVDELVELGPCGLYPGEPTANQFTEVSNLSPEIPERQQADCLR